MTKLDKTQQHVSDLYQKRAQMQLFDGEPTMERIMANEQGDTLYTFVVCEAQGVDVEELRERLHRASYELVMLAESLEGVS